MSLGTVTVNVDTAALEAAVTAACARLEAAAALAGAGATSSTPAALIGAAAAALELKRPVPRRALIFPWLWRGRGRA